MPMDGVTRARILVRHVMMQKSWALYVGAKHANKNELKFCMVRSSLGLILRYLYDVPLFLSSFIHHS